MDTARPDDEPRPRVTATFGDREDPASPLLCSLGPVIFAVAALEKSLQLELSRLRLIQRATMRQRAGLSLRQQLHAMDGMTAGRLLSELRKLRLPEELDRRIAAVVRRRNTLVHQLHGDADLVRALNQGGDDAKAMSDRFDRLALDAAELAVELQLFALPKLESMLGMSVAQAVELISAVDMHTIDDPREREQMAAVRAPDDVHELANVLEDLAPAVRHRPTRTNSVGVASRADDVRPRNRCGQALGGLGVRLGGLGFCRGGMDAEFGVVLEGTRRRVPALRQRRAGWAHSVVTKGFESPRRLLKKPPQMRGFSASLCLEPDSPAHIRDPWKPFGSARHHGRPERPEADRLAS